MWVNVISTRSDDNKYKLNLSTALGIREYDDRFEVYYAGDNDPYKVKKTPEMVEAYNSLVSEKSQPVVPAESEGPFRITGLGLYETRRGATVHITDKDLQDCELPWVSHDMKWYSNVGKWCGNDRQHDIVKLIKLDEVQP